MQRLSNQQYEEFLYALAERNGLIPEHREWAEHWILYGQWSASKLNGIGLELSDFYPQNMSLNEVHLREIERRIRVQISRAEEQKYNAKLDTVTAQIRSELDIDKVLDSYAKELTRIQADKNSAEEREERLKRDCEYLQREVRRLERENGRLRESLYAQSSQKNQDHDVLNYQPFEEAA